MEKQILVSMVVIGVATGALGAGTFAYFTASAASTSNLFTATSIALSANHQQSVTATIGSANFLPGDVVSGNLTLSRAGTALDGNLHTDFAWDLAQVSATGSATNMADYLEVTSLTYGGTDLLAACYGSGDANHNGWIDLGDLHASPCLNQASPGSAGSNLALGVKFRPEAGNDLQGASVTLGMRFLLAQNGAPAIAANPAS
jgi:predicted ribosomally synthesized peptide with SipW-like signal peptide